jgi:anaerobic ribonucleoside-triphosphate reductase activating protein
MLLSLSRVHFPVTTLGPGRRVGIWFQGCSIGCPGCISGDTWSRRVPDVSVRSLVQELKPWTRQCDGLTISGGEPFEQAPALLALLRELRAESPKSILVYTGLALEDLHLEQFLADGLIDALITDPYLDSGAQTKPIRGSDNQRLHCLTPRGVEDFSSYERELTGDDKQLDIMFDSDGTVWMAGIPKRGDIEALQGILKEQGNTMKTTAVPMIWK